MISRKRWEAIIGATVVTVLNLQVLKGMSLWINDLKNAGVTVLGRVLQVGGATHEAGRLEVDVDWAVLGGTLAFIAIYGMWRARGGSTSEQYLRGGNQDRWATIGLSVMATQASAITFMSVPGQAYEDGMRFVLGRLGPSGGVRAVTAHAQGLASAHGTEVAVAAHRRLAAAPSQG